ncbi:hypothetical protein ABIC83_002454 [Roseateles asaccharophilus]|uniref:hypothetical protein n=1 Tax=Roseateles asaccharophilus TaxID=582607 RepID=UPI003836F860
MSILKSIASTSAVIGACLLLSSCQTKEEAAIGEQLAATKGENWKSIQCGPVAAGQRPCVVTFEWADKSTTIVNVTAEAGEFEGDSYEVEWNYGDYCDLRDGCGRAWRATFSTTVKLKEHLMGDVVAWVTGQNKQSVQQAEITAKEVLAMARRKQQIWQSYRGR